MHRTDCAQSRYRYSLVELIIVLAILATLTVALTLPQTSAIQSESKDSIRAKEMSDIVLAFQQLYDDVQPSDTTLDEADKYGLWMLFSMTHPDGGSDLTAYDFSKNTGWAGPYAHAEDLDQEINAGAGTGQPAQSGGTAIPTIKDPYDGYYRVLLPDAGTNRYTRLALVCTGPDQTLQTTDTADGNGNIAAAGDDTVMRLIPLGP